MATTELTVPQITGHLPTIPSVRIG